MLKSIYLKNYALFDETRIYFPEGLNILTGETGAGKTLLVGALGLITGKRADSSAVFYPDKKCVVEAEFQVPGYLEPALEEIDAFDLEGNSLTIRRLINPGGKSRAFINDAPASLQVIRAVSSLMLDLHSQNENQDLLNPERQMALLDEYVGNAEALDAYRTALAEYQITARELSALVEQEAQAREQQDYWAFQLEELRQAQVSRGEEAQLTKELALLQNAENIRESLDFASATLYHEDNSVFNQISEVNARLEKSGNLLASYVEQLRDMEERLKELGFELDGLKEQAESDPGRLAEIEGRLALYHDLVRKYKVADGDGLVDRLQEISGRVGDFESLTGRIAELERALLARKEAVVRTALTLENRRESGRKGLETAINQLLQEVGFKDAEMEIRVSRFLSDSGNLEVEGERVQTQQTGINKVAYFIRTNPGLPMGPLSQIASGGEVSRVMLAIKTALADKAAFPVLIFDEIDTGISGEIAHRVGRVMRRLSSRFQIIAITHLPQIAARGHAHFLIEKINREGKTISGVRRLSDDERVQTLATMIHGDALSETALANARELMLKE